MAPPRSARRRRGLTSGFSRRHAFQTSTPSLSRDSWASSASSLFNENIISIHRCSVLESSKRQVFNQSTRFLVYLAIKHTGVSFSFYMVSIFVLVPKNKTVRSYYSDTYLASIARYFHLAKFYQYHLCLPGTYLRDYIIFDSVTYCRFLPSVLNWPILLKNSNFFSSGKLFSI